MQWLCCGLADLQLICHSPELMDTWLMKTTLISLVFAFGSTQKKVFYWNWFGILPAHYSSTRSSWNVKYLKIITDPPGVQLSGGANRYRLHFTHTKHTFCFTKYLNLQQKYFIASFNIVEGPILITDSEIISKITFYYFSRFCSVNLFMTKRRLVSGQLKYFITKSKLSLLSQEEDQTGMSNIGW